MDMTNDKQQTAVELFWNQLPEILPFTVDTETAMKLLKAFEQSKKFEKERMIQLVQGLKDYTHESHTILGHDERDASEFVDVFYNETYGGGEQ
jgi:hypothetical protein